MLMESTPGLDLDAIAKGQWLVLTCSWLGRILNKQSTVGFVLNKQSQANCALKLARLRKIQQVGNRWNVAFVRPLIYFALRHAVIRWPNCGKLKNPTKHLQDLCLEKAAFKLLCISHVEIIKNSCKMGECKFVKQKRKAFWIYLLRIERIQIRRIQMWRMFYGQNTVDFQEFIHFSSHRWYRFLNSIRSVSNDF